MYVLFSRQPPPPVKQNHPQALTARPQQPAVAMTPMTTRAPIFYKQKTAPGMTEAKSLPLGVPAFKPLKTPATLAIYDGATSPIPTPTNNLQLMKQKLHQPGMGSPPMDAQKKQLMMQLQRQQPPKQPGQQTFSRKVAMFQYPNGPNLALANATFIQSQLAMQGMHPRPQSAALSASNYAPVFAQKYAPVPISPAAGPFKVAVPAFQSMPSSVSRISTGQIVHLDVNGKAEAVNPNSIYASNIKRDVSVERCCRLNRSYEKNPSCFQAHKPGPIQQNSVSSTLASLSDHSLPQVDLKGHTVEELAAVANVSVDAIKKAISLRQKQLVAEQDAQLKRQMEQEANLMRQRQEAEIANQLAMYQYQQQQYLATSTSSTTTKTTTAPTTTTTRQTTARRPSITPRPVMAGGQKVCNFLTSILALKQLTCKCCPPLSGNECTERILSSWLRQEFRR